MEKQEKILTKIVYLCLIIFVSFYLCFGAMGKWTGISLYQLVLQLLFAIVSFSYCRKNAIIIPSQIFRYTFLFQFSLAILLKLLFVLFEKCEFGPSAVDSINYFEYGYIGSNMSAERLIDQLSDTDWSGIDDRGYIFYLRFFYMVMPKEIVPYVVICFNALFIAVSATVLYKTLIILSPNNKRNALCVISIFSSFLFFVNTSAVGLKEDIFVTAITLAVFYYVKFVNDKKFKYFLLSLIFVFMTIYFRMSITASIAAVFMVGIVTNSNNRKYIVLGFVLSLLALPLILDIILQNVLGTSLESILAVAQYRNEDTSGADSGSKQIGNILASIIGPFPTFVDASDNMFYSYSSMVKMIFNLPVLWALFKVLSDFNYKYYFASFLYSIGIIFTIISGTGLDMRYQIPFFIAFLILLFVYLNTSRIKPIIFAGYILGCSTVTFVYNIMK